MARIVCMALHGVGDDSFGIQPEMFMIDGVIPFDVRLRSAGRFLRCAYSSTSILHLDNPVSDSTFEFEIDYKLTEDPSWISGATWYMVGNLYHSLGHLPIKTSDIKNSIGISSNKFYDMTTSALINAYSKYKSDKVAPFNKGKWALYTHTMPGGMGFGYDVYSETTLWGAYGRTISPITWLYSYKLLAWLNTIWVAMAGYPYNYVKLEVGGVMSDPVALTAGCRGMTKWGDVITNNDAAGATKTYYIKSYHCATSGGTYVQGQSATVTVTHSAKPYSVSVHSTYPRKHMDTATIIVDYVGSGNLIRFSVKPHTTWEYVDEQTYGNLSNISMELVHADTIAIGSQWKLEVDYPAGSGLFRVEAQGSMQADPADLRVSLVAPAAISIPTSRSFNVTVRIYNFGETDGQEYFDWNINNGTTTISSGTHLSGVIIGGSYEQHVITLTTPSSPGTYYVACKATGNTSFVFSTAMTVYSSISGSITGQVNVSIYGYSNGSVTVAGSGGVGPYDYSIGGAYQASGTFGGLSAAGYTVTVRDAYGVTYGVGVNITQPAALYGYISYQANVTGYLGSDGVVVVTASGGVTPYEYSIASTWQTSGTFSGLPAGNYTVTILDHNAAEYTVPVTITAPGKPYTISNISTYRSAMDTVGINFTVLNLTGYTVMFEAKDVNGNWNYNVLTVDDGPNNIELSSGSTFATGSTFPYRLSVWWDNQWMLEMSRS